MDKDNLYGEELSVSGSTAEISLKEEDLKKVKKHFSKLGLMYFLGTIIIMVVQFGTMALVQALLPEALSNMDAAFLLTMFPMYAVGMPLMALLIRLVPAERISKHNMLAGKWMIAFLMCYAVMYLSNIVGQLITLVIGVIKGSMVPDALTAIASSINPWVAILTMVLITPVAEEYLFRKMLIDRTVKYGEGLAVLLSAFMFGLFHGNLNQFAYAFTLGLLLGFIYVKTGKIIYTTLLHMLINFMGSVVAMWVLKVSGYEDLIQMSLEDIAAQDPTQLFSGAAIFFLYAFILLGLVIAGFVLLIVERKKFTCKQGAAAIPKKKRFSAVILNPGMLLFVLCWMAMIVAQLFS